MESDSADTTETSYWWNRRFFLSSGFVLTTVIVAGITIWKYEGRKRERGEIQGRTVGFLYDDEAWNTSFKVIHPGWLLAYRIVALGGLLSVIIMNYFSEGPTIFLFYTQCTFCLVTIYFVVGTTLSIYGCYNNHNNKVIDDPADDVLDEEKNISVAPTFDAKKADTPNLSKRFTYEDCFSLKDTPITSKRFTDEICSNRKPAGLCVYIFQALYQICGGAVLLTDVIFWGLLYPFVWDPEYDELDYLVVSLHLQNFVFLFGDTVLNNMRFPMFRIAYFMLWTITYVTVQWIVHACVDLWWPYPFLGLSSSYAPLWYLLVGMVHIPCYCGYALIVKLKHMWFTRFFPNSFRG